MVAVIRRTSMRLMNMLRDSRLPTYSLAAACRPHAATMKDIRRHRYDSGIAATTLPLTAITRHYAAA